MTEPPSPTVGADSIVVVGADEQSDVHVDVDRWCRLAEAVLGDLGRHGELTLTFVDRGEIAGLNELHLGKHGATDVLSFPLDAELEDAGGDVPVLLGDVVICPDVAREQAPGHAGTLEDELALLVVHGVLHVVGHDHVTPDETAAMRSRERDLLATHHWDGHPPAGFRQEQDSP